MPVNFFNDVERERLKGFPKQIPTEDLITYFTLSEPDIVEIQKLRGAHNKLGFAIQLCTLRYLGFSPDDLSITPSEIVSFLATQLDLALETISSYGKRTPTRIDHYNQAQEYLGFRKATQVDIDDLANWLIERALEHDKPSFLLQLSCEKLFYNKIVRIGISRLERLVATARQEAHIRTFQKIAPILTKDCRSFLDNFLVPDEITKRTSLTELRKEATGNGANDILRDLKKIVSLREVDVEDWDISGINPNRRKLLARIGRKASNQYLQRISEERRYPILIAFLHESLISIVDEVIEMFDRCLWELYSGAQKDLEKHQQAIFKTLNEKLIIFNDLAKIIVDQKVDHKDVRSIIFDNVIPREYLCEAIEETEKVVRPIDGHLDFFSKSYSYIRRFAPSFLDAFDFRASTSNTPLLKAIVLLRELNKDKPQRKIPKDAPSKFITDQWKAYVFNQEGNIRRRYYEMSTLWQLRAALRSGDVWIEKSRRYANVKSYLMPPDRWKKLKPEVCRQIKAPEDGTQRLHEREKELEELFFRVEGIISEEDSVRLEDKRIVVSPIKADDRPESVIALEKNITKRLPKIDLVDLLVEVDSWTSFSSCFTHASGSEVRSKDFLKHLYACIFAQACGFGLEQFGQIAEISYDRLAWCNNWYIREETIKPAFTKVVNYHHIQPLSQYWGDGTLSSSDGQRFPVSGKIRKAASIPKYFGYGRGVTFYSWTSNQLSQYGTKFIVSTIRDATYVLDEILNNETDLQILEHTTDTAGYTELVFALFDLLGMKFSPRISDIAGQHIYRPESINIKDLESLKHQVKGIINRERILKQWDDLFRVAGSLKLGWVTALLLIQKLQSFPRKNELTRALQEYGRLIKSIYVLKWYEDKTFRRRIGIQLNKGEALHSLRSSFHIANRGYIRRKDSDGLTNQVNCLNLITNAVITWNTVYMAAAIEQMKKEGQDIMREDIKHIWPTRFEHINVYGKYNFDVNEEHLQRRGLRPLRTEGPPVNMSWSN